MTQLTAAEIAMAFTAQNDKKGWLARTNAKPDKGMDLVHFTAPSQLISLTYNAMDGKFMVRFHKLHASWGDYIKSIAKTLYYILTVLKAAGLPFEAPLSAAGIQIIATASDDNTVYVEWPDMHRGGFRTERTLDQSIAVIQAAYGAGGIDVVSGSDGGDIVYPPIGT